MTNPFVQIILFSVVSAVVLVPAILIGLSSIGLFEPLEFKIFGHTIRTGKHPPVRVITGTNATTYIITIKSE